MIISHAKMAYKIISFNMHGFEQGNLILTHMCNDLLFDIIYIQEHWLSPDNLYKLCTISDRYICVGVSALENKLSTSVLYGRPYGSVSILINDIYKASLRIIKCAERYVLIALGGVVF